MEVRARVTRFQPSLSFVIGRQGEPLPEHVRWAEMYLQRDACLYPRFRSDNWTMVTSDGSWTAQFEHTLLITNDGCRVLTVTGEGSGAALKPGSVAEGARYCAPCAQLFLRLMMRRWRTRIGQLFFTSAVVVSPAQGRK